MTPEENPWNKSINIEEQEMEGKWVLGLMCILLSLTREDGRVSGMEIEVSGKAMYVLGDSSVDCGDNTPFAHKNQSQFPCNGSDATLLPQLLAKKMGLPYIIPFYTQNGSILGGVNFGSSEATILYPGSRSYQSLNQQLRQAFETLQLLHLHLGEDTASRFIRSSIFYLSFGKDDFSDYFLDNSSHTGNFTQILVHQMANAVRSLYASSVRKIVCAGVVPLGCTPHLLLRLNGTSHGCVDEVNRVVLEYNTKLEQSLVAMNEEFRDARLVFCDVYRAVLELVNNPKAYGIKEVRNACCGGECGCVSKDMACLEAWKHVWWDLDNPTPAVNSLLADSFWSAHPLPSICRPINLQELLFSSV